MSKSNQAEKFVLVALVAIGIVLMIHNMSTTRDYEYPQAMAAPPIKKSHRVIDNAASDSYANNLEKYPYNLLAEFQQTSAGSPTIPYFFHVHKSGGTSLRGVFTCLQKIQTRRINRAGVCEDDENLLRVCKLPFGEELVNRVINIDPSSLSGIQRGADLGLVEKGTVKGLVDSEGNEESFIVATSRFYDALNLFTPQRKAQLFILFRHPVHRIISKYYYLKKATWENSYRESVASMTLLEYASSKYCDNNWVTRRLVNKMDGDLELSDLELAKEILSRKALILLLDDLEESIERLRVYFGWHHDSLVGEQRFCLRKFIKEEPINVNPDKPVISTTSVEWLTIRDKNLMDIELMAFATTLYKEQGKKLYR